MRMHGGLARSQHARVAHLGDRRLPRAPRVDRPRVGASRGVGAPRASAVPEARLALGEERLGALPGVLRGGDPEEQLTLGVEPLVEPELERLRAGRALPTARPPPAARRAAPRAPAPRRRRRPARPRALTRPSSSARSALTSFPSSSSSAAAVQPARRGSRWVPPPPGISPSVTSGTPKRARGSATIRSQTSMNSKPPPTALAWTAATTGWSSAAPGVEHGRG